MLREFLADICALSSKASATEIIPVGFRSYLEDSELQKHAAPPRLDTVYDLAGLAWLCELYGDKGVVYCSHANNLFYAVAVLSGKERADQVTLNAKLTRQCQALEAVAHGMTVKDLSEVLRTALNPAVSPDFIHAVSRVDWAAAEGHQADAATMGRNVSKTVSADGAGLPTTVPITIAIFDVHDALIEVDIPCAVIANHEARTIAIVPIEGFDALKDNALDDLRDRIRDRVCLANETDADAAEALAPTIAAVVIGRPDFLGFEPGKPNT